MATGAQLNQPVGIAVDTMGNVYVGEQSANKIRKISLDSSQTSTYKKISTIAGPIHE